MVEEGHHLRCLAPHKVSLRICRSEYEMIAFSSFFDSWTPDLKSQAL